MRHETALTHRTISALLLSETPTTDTFRLLNAISALGHRAVALPAFASPVHTRVPDVSGYIEKSASVFLIAGTDSASAHDVRAQRDSIEIGAGAKALWYTVIPGAQVPLGIAMNAHAIPIAALVSNDLPTMYLRDLLDRNISFPLSDIVRQSSTANPAILSREHLKTLTIHAYNNIAEQFTDVWSDHLPLRPLERFRALLPRSATVLDAGCGPGHHSAFLQRSGLDVIGVDLSARMIQIARKSTSHVTFALMDIEHLVSPDGLFDGIWCTASALHIPRERLGSLLVQFRRALKPGGVLALGMQIGRVSEITSDYRFFEYYDSGVEIEEALVRSGFRIVETDIGATRRNTHGADIELTWATVFGRVTSDREDFRLLE